MENITQTIFLIQSIQNEIDTIVTEYKTNFGSEEAFLTLR